MPPLRRSEADYTKSWTKLCEQFYYNTTLPIKELEQKSSRFSLDKASTGDIMQAAIGQGTVLTTPLQNSFLVSAALNDGVLMKPYLVDRIQTHDGDVVTKNEPEQAKQLLSTEEAAVLRRYMRETVTSGTATAFLPAVIRLVERRDQRSIKQVPVILTLGLSVMR